MADGERISRLGARSWAYDKKHKTGGRTAACIRPRGSAPCKEDDVVHGRGPAAAAVGTGGFPGLGEHRPGHRRTARSIRRLRQDPSDRRRT